MQIKFLLIFLVLFTSSNALAKPKIVTTITPIAGIISMLTKDSAEVSAINISSGCPHHYHMKPSDAGKILNADVLIYIDKDFDGSIEKISENSHGKIIKISGIKELDLNDGNNKPNWHFWLNLENIAPLQQATATFLITKFPAIKENILYNKIKAQAAIRSLIELKKNKLAAMPELIVVSDSLEHFFKNEKVRIIKLYQQDNFSLQSYSKLQEILKTDANQCIVLDMNQNIDIYKKFNKKIVQLNSENWATNQNIVNPNLFRDKYIEILDQLERCK